MQLKFPLLVFDIETITDVQAGSQLYDLDLSPDEARQALAKIHRQDLGTDFPRLPLHQIVCISGLWLDDRGIQVFSWTQEQHSEVELLHKFVKIFQHKQPILISWNGVQFDLPVIMYRCLYHGISAPALFEQGDFNPKQRYDNYQNRYQLRHTDLMDQLAKFNLRHAQKLNDVAKLLGYAGNLGILGEHIEQHVAAKNWAIVRQHCESDVLNTWLIYLRWLLVRGQMNVGQHQAWIQHTIGYLRSQDHHQAFLAAWQKHGEHTAFTQDDFQSQSI